MGSDVVGNMIKGLDSISNVIFITISVLSSFNLGKKDS